MKHAVRRILGIQNQYVPPVGQDSGFRVKKRIQNVLVGIFNVMPPESVDIRIHYPINIWKQFAEIKSQKRHRRALVRSKFAADTLSLTGLFAKDVELQPRRIGGALDHARLGDFQPRQVSGIRRHHNMYTPRQRFSLPDYPASRPRRIETPVMNAAAAVSALPTDWSIS